ncbi:MAG: sulfite exporter TauE/SafE family protein, partial [Candidatus Bathyarchaeota archaeon]
MVESGLTITLGLGFRLGLGHTLDVDHVVAISTILSENKSLKKTSVLGVLWGLGHTTTLFLAGLIVLAFAASIPQTLALSFEFIVGIILVMLGLFVIRNALGRFTHVHQHSHKGKVHSHFHNHRKSVSHAHEHKSFIVGMFHGLAGSAPLMLLVIASLRSIWEGLTDILIFGLGSISGMLTISTLIGLPLTLTSTRFEKWNQRIRLAAGFL